MENTPTPNNNQSTPTIPKSGKNPAVIIAVVVGALVAIAAIIFVVCAFLIPKDEAETQPDDQQTSQDSEDTDAKQEDLKTLSIGDLSVKYPAAWQPSDDEDTSEDSVAVDNGEDRYLMLTYNNGEEPITTAEFAELSTEAFKEIGFTIAESAKSQTINGKEWSASTVSSDGVWLKIFFYAEGNDNYMVTFSTDDKAALDDATARNIFSTITLK